jgi:hypothetical protein
MGKEHVFGLIIDPVTTDMHFTTNHEMFGTLRHRPRKNRKDFSTTDERQWY